MENLKDIADKSKKKASSSSTRSSSSRSSSDSGDDYPRYIEETPFLAVFKEGGSIRVRNEPEDIAIVYRQYQKDSDLKKHEVPDSIIEYWLTDWSFKRASYRYQNETGESLIEDLRENAIKTLEILRDAPKGKGATTPQIKCAVCGDELDKQDEYVTIQSKRVHSHHTAEELVDENVLNLYTTKQVTDKAGEAVREAPDTKNRRWE